MKIKQKKLLYTPEGDLTETGEKVKKLIVKKLTPFMKARLKEYDRLDLIILMENVIVDVGYV